MTSIKTEPTEGESPLNGHPSLPLIESTNQSTVKCEWSLKGACADGKCDDCKASEMEDEKDATLKIPVSSPLNSPENDEMEFYPPKWEDCEAAAENTGNASDMANVANAQVFEPNDNNLAGAPVIGQVSPVDSSSLSPEPGNTSKETEIGEAEASQVTVHDPLSPVALGRSTRAQKGTLPEQQSQEIIANNEGSATTEPDNEAEKVGGQAKASVSSLSLRRSTRVRKSTVNYGVLPEAEEEAQQDEPNTDTSDSEKSDSDETETEIETEIETEMEEDEHSETRESYPIAANGGGSRLYQNAFPCGQCKKVFTSKRNARCHENTLHDQIKRRRPYVCSAAVCGKAFAFQSHLDIHRLIHSGLRPFTCATCGAAFNQKSNLKSHQRTHTHARTYACQVCPKVFKWKQALVHHSLFHSVLNPLTCTKCGSSFSSKANLERHLQKKIPCAGRYAPSESRPFSCTVAGCGKAFKVKQALQTHTHTHSEFKAFKCSVCGGAFTFKSSLKIHRRKFHSI